jgi:hypothetical protein
MLRETILKEIQIMQKKKLVILKCLQVPWRNQSMGGSWISND